LSRISYLVLTASCFNFPRFVEGNKKALAKFVRCINWRSRGEAAQALELVNKWAPMDAEDALELLGPAFAHQGSRNYSFPHFKARV
jgi:phosphatidylinositol 3-kinase